MSNNSAPIFSDNVVPGFVSSPDTRGTLDILFSCAITFALCSWSCICCNVPAPTDTAVRHFGRKAFMTIFSAFGPEFTLYLALGQWLSAKQSVKAFHQLGYSQWTLQHAFYADMGGFRLQLADIDAFPVSGSSLAWLIQEKLFTKQQINQVVFLEKRSIDDRNKADVLVRTFALAQTLWFMVNVMVRICKGYQTTALELSVMGYLLPTLATYWLWWHKPRDIETSITIDVNVSLASLQDRAGPEALDWRLTPLDFVEREEFTANVLWKYWLNMFMSPFRLCCGRQPRSNFAKSRTPRQYRTDHDVPIHCTPSRYSWIEVVPAFTYVGIPFIAWNWHFPSTAERDLWRCSCIAMAAAYVAAAIYGACLALFYPQAVEQQQLSRYRDGRPICEERLQPGGKGDLASLYARLTRQVQIVCQRMRNNSVDDDPQLDVSFRWLIPATILGAVYGSSRIYMLVEDLIGLRAMPAGVYQEIPWSEVFHFSS